MSLTAYDADVLIYAATVDHGVGGKVATLLESKGGVGSVLLLPEVLTKPMRADPDSGEVESLLLVLSRLELLPFHPPTARLAVALGVEYGLRAADAAHLATAVEAGADTFLTNNRRDFTSRIAEIEVVYPDALPMWGE